ncbi:MAG: hypothetical protein JO206_01490, partial [Solirubrobacterales bacterium]|nr:hypothetical protein [Solirubrobacterales bacterium]
RSATVAELQQFGSRLLSFYGQHEHRKLMLASAQLQILDAYCGAGALELRSQVREAYEQLRDRQHRVAELEGMAGARDRELDLLTFELTEIEAAAPSEREQSELIGERERLRHLGLLRDAALAGAEAIAPDGGAGAAELLAGPAAVLEQAAAIDPRLGPFSERLSALRYEAEDLAGELRRYAAELEGGGAGITEAGGSGRLEEIEERLALLSRLERKHGGSIAAVLAHAERCRTRHEQLAGAEVALERARAELDQARAQVDRLAATLSAKRVAAAPELSAAVRERLGELAMPDAHFVVQVGPRPEGCGPSGSDAVELEFGANPGVAPGPLRALASGGELSRVMLAILSVAHGESGGDPQAAPLLVFDEVDAGIGGHTARAVGEHLRSLAHGRQILCITHLPQVAARAARHFTIVKDATTVPASTRVRALDGDQVVGELVRMLGAGDGDQAASQHARQLLQAA